MLAIGVLGETSVGCHQSVLTDLLDSMSADELSQFVSTTELCTFGLATGLSRVSNCLVVAAPFHPALRLTRTVADSFLTTFENVRLGLEIFRPNVT